MFNYCPPKSLPDLKSETFPDGKRYYTLEDGTRLPSVTTVLGAQKKQAIMEWRKRVGDEEAKVDVDGEEISLQFQDPQQCEDRDDFDSSVQMDLFSESREATAT